MVSQRVGNNQPARSAVDVAEFLAGLGDHRRIHDGQHLFDVVQQEPVEKNFVGVLELTLARKQQAAGRKLTIQ